MFEKTFIEAREKGVHNIHFLGADQPGVELHGIAEDHSRDSKMEAPVDHVVPCHTSRRWPQDEQNYCKSGACNEHWHTQ